MDQPIRVLHCVAGLSRGGFETFLMNVYRQIDRSKVQFDFLYSFDGVYMDEIHDLGGKTYQIPFITQKGPFVYRKAVMAFFKRHPEYKIVHSHMDKFSGMIMECAKRSGVPVRIAHSHSTKNEGGLAFHLVKNYYGKKILPNCTHKMGCSQDAYQWLFGREKDMLVVKNGIDTEKFTNIDHRDFSRFTVVHIGRFNAVKNHTFLLDIFAELYRMDSTAQLILAGSGDLMKKMQKKAENLRISPAVTFLGDCNDIPGLLTKADVLCMPSLFEGLGIAAVEAQAAGVPCVLSDQIPKESNVSGACVFLPLDAPAKQWAEALLQYKHTAKQDNRRKILAAGYDIRHTASILQELYLCEGGRFDE